MAMIPDRPAAPIAPLPCGRDAAQAWDRAEAGLAPDEHERGCPHCTRCSPTPAGCTRWCTGWPPSRSSRRPPRCSGPCGRCAPSSGQHELLALPSPYGPARLSRPAAAAVLRQAVDRMSGVRARSCRIEQAAGADAAPPAARITIGVAARYGVELTSVAARVRQMVGAAAEQALGLPVSRVDVEVVDVVEEGIG